MRKERFVTENFYHIYNRGVDKRLVFMDDADRIRFVVGLYFFNDVNFFSNNFFRLSIKQLLGQDSVLTKKKRDSFVDIVAWCLMPNHFHLLVRQRKDAGVSRFMHKLGVAYTMYFNKRHERSGALFQGAFKARAVADDMYLTHLSRYIHLNPLELRYKDWKKNGMGNIAGAWNFLKAYHWSSLPVYFDMSERKKAFDGIISKDFLLSTFDGNLGEYQRFLEEWIRKGPDSLVETES